MNEIFKKLFAKNNLPEADVASFAKEFSSVVFVTLVGATNDKLSEDERMKIQQFWKDGKSDEVFSLIKNKYSEEEWEKTIEAHIMPLWKSYTQEVVHLGK